MAHTTALSYVDYVSDDLTTSEWAFTFPRMSDDHVKVEYAGVVQEHTTISTSPDKIAVFTDSGKLTTKGVSVISDIVRVYRETPGTTVGSSGMTVDFQDGSVLTEADLDRAMQQLLYVSQESHDRGSAALKVTANDTWDGKGHRISNLADGIEDNDVVLKKEVDTALNIFNSYASPDDYSLTEQCIIIPAGATYADYDSTVPGATSIHWTHSASTPTPVTARNIRCIVSVDGVVQIPDTVDANGATVQNNFYITLGTGPAGAEGGRIIFRGEDLTDGAGLLKYVVSIQIPY